MTKVILKYRTLFFSIFLVGGSLYLNLLFAKLDPEIHHDGVIFPAAVAASEGLVPNRDFFTQYGPLGPIFQGFWIDLTSPTLLSLRNLSAFLITLSTVLVILLTYRAWGLFLSSLIATTSAIAYPTVLPAMLPWPTLITTNLILICMLILQRIETLEMNRRIKYLFYVIGVLLGIGFYVRLHLIAVLMSLFIAVYIKKSKEHNPWILLFGFMNIIFIMTIYQLKTNSFMHFVEQCIFFPIGNYGGVSKGIKPAIVDLALFLMFFLYAGLSFLFFCISRPLVSKNFLSWKKTLLLGTSTLGFLFIYKIGKGANQLPVEERSFINPLYLSLWISEHFRYLIAYSSIGILLLYALSFLISKINLRSKSPHVTSLGVGALAQLYPSPDQLHVWWIAPVAIVCISKIIESSALFEKILRIFISSLLATQLVHITDVLHVERFNYQAPIYLHMVGTEKGIDNSTKAVANLMISRQSFFHCTHGIYAASTGSYLPASFDFVDWGPQEEGKIHKKGTHFSCNHKIDFLPKEARILWAMPDNNFYIWVNE